MFKIKKAEFLNDITYLMEVEAEHIAKSCQPGQFLIVKIDEKGERVPLTICDYDREAGTVTIVFQILGSSTKKMAELKAGDYFRDFVGPLGVPSEFVTEDINEIKHKKVLFVAGGVGTAPIYPQVKWMKEHGVAADVIIGARNKDILLLEDQMRSVAGNLYITTDDGSYGTKGLVTDVIKDLVLNQGKKYDIVVAIGPMIMMKFVCMTTKELGIKTVVSLNPIMVDGTGMCGACRVSIGGEIKFACVDGPEFDGHLVNFDEAMKRQQMYKTEEGRTTLEKTEGETHHHGACEVNAHEEKKDMLKRVPVREQDPQVRATNFEEVCYGYDMQEAMEESERCLNCKNAKCIQGCPVSIDIPSFIMKVKGGDVKSAFDVINESSALPAVCGRVCPQESQCEKNCIRGIKGDSVSIGKLERFVADWARDNGVSPIKPEKTNGKKVAIIGAGPAGLTCAGDLAKLGYEVTIFEALHEPGGVLVYGIPEFRLPKEKVVNVEIENVKKLGVKIETNVIIGRTVTIDQLEEDGFLAIFIGSGAGLPNFMGIPGENANGVFSANEYLTRSNLMKAFRNDYDTPIFKSKRLAVVGGGNVAMDAARTAKRLGAEVYVIYRRSEKELPARLEEVHHAKEEGIIFEVLTNPTEVLADEKGWVKGIKCVRMELGEPDASGRRRPIEVPNSEFEIEVDSVIMALGTSPNPLISSTTEGLELNKHKCLIVEESGQTTRQGVFAGGDAVTGAATVILAMEAGKIGAKGIHDYLSKK
jgi:glutamate synthase (NADPH/NADH) small chain